MFCSLKQQRTKIWEPKSEENVRWTHDHCFSPFFSCLCSFASLLLLFLAFFERKKMHIKLNYSCFSQKNAKKKKNAFERCRGKRHTKRLQNNTNDTMYQIVRFMSAIVVVLVDGSWYTWTIFETYAFHLQFFPLWVSFSLLSSHFYFIFFSVSQVTSDFTVILGIRSRCLCEWQWQKKIFFFVSRMLVRTKAKEKMSCCRR